MARVAAVAASQESSMNVETESFTVGVFKDIEWARKGVEALRRHGFTPETLSIVVKATPEATALAQEVVEQPAAAFDLPRVGPVVAAGPLVAALGNGMPGDLPSLGIAGTMRRVGFQAHDGEIYERLTAAGGVLIAIQSEPRAADALAVLHNYGGGNAAIGAWQGRV
jgi:hypothetical protein